MSRFSCGEPLSLCAYSYLTWFAPKKRDWPLLSCPPLSVAISTIFHDTLQATFFTPVPNLLLHASTETHMDIEHAATLYC